MKATTRKIKAMQVVSLLLVVLSMFFSGCSPLSNEATAALFQSMQERSSCFLIGGGAGGGAIVIPTTSIPMTGGYGYAWGARAMPGHSVHLDASGCTITVAPTVQSKDRATIP